MTESSLDADLRDLIFRFFYKFSRFEFALKEAGFLRSHVPGKRAEPDWLRFIEKYDDDYRPTEAAQALIDANPKQQVVGDNGHGLDFKHVELAADASELGRVVAIARTVRNNLFHGGKHDSEGWDNPNRIRQLLELCIKVLDELADHGGLRSDYEGLY